MHGMPQREWSMCKGKPAREKRKEGDGLCVHNSGNYLKALWGDLSCNNQARGMTTVKGGRRKLREAKKLFKRYRQWGGKDRDETTMQPRGRLGWSPAEAQPLPAKKRSKAQTPSTGMDPSGDQGIRQIRKEEEEK